MIFIKKNAYIFISSSADVQKVGCMSCDGCLCYGHLCYGRLCYCTLPQYVYCFSAWAYTCVCTAVETLTSSPAVIQEGSAED